MSTKYQEKQFNVYILATIFHVEKMGIDSPDPREQFITDLVIQFRDAIKNPDM
jgi:hypothetical protein